MTAAWRSGAVDGSGLASLAKLTCYSRAADKKSLSQPRFIRTRSLPEGLPFHYTAIFQVEGATKLRIPAVRHAQEPTFHRHVGMALPARQPARRDCQVRLGPAPYGYALSDDVDARGRMLLVSIPSEQEVVDRIKTLRKEGHSFVEIAGLLNAEGILARRNGVWRGNRVWIILQREGVHQARRNGPITPRRYNPELATEIAQKLREEGLSLAQIGKRLWKEKLTPQRGGKWHPAQVAKILERAGGKDWTSAARRAADWRAQGMTLKEIGVRLTMDGYQTKEGGMWFPSTVAGLISSVESKETEHQVSDF